VHGQVAKLHRQPQTAREGNGRGQGLAFPAGGPALLGDFLEGVRAAIIDKDKTPVWRHTALDAVPPSEVAAMLLPLGAEGLTF